MAEEGRNDAGKFVEGNRFWEQAIYVYRKRGADPKYANADELIEDCAGYFADITENPLYEEKVFNSGEAGISTHDTPKMRAMTLKGLCNYIGIVERTWRLWRKKRDDLKPAIAFIEQIIYQQKFEGAAAGLLHHAIIARDLGLADTTKLAGHDGGALKVEDGWTDLERARRLAFVLAEAVNKQQEQKNDDSEAE